MVALQAFNTFGINAHAPALLEIESEDQLLDLLPGTSPADFLILGGGSNILFCNDPQGTVLLNRIKGRRIVEEEDQEVVIAVGSGENWHELVLWTLDHNWGGLENLSLIPGTVGAAPIQNIGAYGVELKDVLVGLEAIEWRTGEQQVFTAEDCAFGYRDSYFKREGKGRYFITCIYLRLQKSPQVNLSYGAIREVLEAQGITEPGIRDVSNAVIQIRSAKLPDPAVVGNAGSFFKNPEIGETLFQALQAQYPHIPHYPASAGHYKVPAGWLIEQCGWKGQRRGQVGCYDKQALVLVNYGGASGAEVWQLAQDIQASVVQRFGIHLEAEVNLI